MTQRPIPPTAFSWLDRRYQYLAAMLAALLLACAAQASEPRHWTATWTASPQPVWGTDFTFPMGAPQELDKQTIRQIARISLGGDRVRIVLSNAYGAEPVVIGRAHVALAGEKGAIDGAGHVLTFSGQTSAVIPPGAPLVSDPVDLAVLPLSKLAVSIFLPEPTRPAGFHWDGRQRAYIAAGDQVDAPGLDGADDTSTARYFLSGIYVDGPQAQDVVAILGDSITDGNGATLDADARWPDYLAQLLAPRQVGVINAGISGARLLSDQMGVNALARFERDVLGQPGVKAVIVLLGINDIGWPHTALAPDTPLPAASELIAAYRQLIARARLSGVRIIGATLMPFEGALQGTALENYYSPEKEQLRQEVNAWMRESGEFDALQDFDALARDPEQPAQLGPEFDSGDHLHPGDAGHKAMAQAVNLDTLFAESSP